MLNEKEIDRLQTSEGKALSELADKLGKIIGYEHKHRKFHLILAQYNKKSYDIVSLLAQTIDYIGSEEKKQ